MAKSMPLIIVGAAILTGHSEENPALPDLNPLREGKREKYQICQRSCHGPCNKHQDHRMVARQRNQYTRPRNTCLCLGGAVDGGGEEETEEESECGGGANETQIEVYCGKIGGDRNGVEGKCEELKREERYYLCYLQIGPRKIRGLIQCITLIKLYNRSGKGTEIDRPTRHVSLAYKWSVDVVVTTTGGIEEDLIKCLAPTYRGDFSLPGAYLRSKGLNRIGNLLVPNDNYCKFEDWIIPIFDNMLREQNTENVLWTPSKLIARLGKEINNESSYLYWAYKARMRPILDF
uniref:Deoxyhypusine synthase n=1 Tax=Cajanus cajan TaxID=3821 RepID=A0A151RGK8_CAJCA|nr:Deoxyhypusine synthase [Cajanus cajan]